MTNWEKYYRNFPNQSPESFRKPRFLLKISRWQEEGGHFYGSLTVDGQTINLQHELTESEAIDISIKYRHNDDETFSRWQEGQKNGSPLYSSRFFSRDDVIEKAHEVAEQITSDKKVKGGYSSEVSEDDYVLEIQG